jgi:hypothetical protein
VGLANQPPNSTLDMENSTDDEYCKLCGQRVPQEIRIFYEENFSQQQFDPHDNSRKHYEVNYDKKFRSMNAL